MARTTGRLVNVMDRPVGTNLTADVSSGASVLPVADVISFKEAGGRLTIEGDTYTYTEIDDEASTITLSSTTTADYDEGFSVLVKPAAREKTAVVMIADASDAVEARIPQPLYPMYPEGVREPEEQELVTLRSTVNGWVVADAQGAPKIIQLPSEDGRITEIANGRFALIHESGDLMGWLEIDGTVTRVYGDSGAEIASEEASVEVTAGGIANVFGNSGVTIGSSIGEVNVETGTRLVVTYNGDQSMAHMALDMDDDYQRHSSFGADPVCYWTVDGDLRLAGIVQKKVGNFTGTLDTVATLPDSLAPLAQQFFPVIGSSGAITGRCRVDTDGTVAIQMNGTTNYASLDGITVSMSALRS